MLMLGRGIPTICQPFYLSMTHKITTLILSFFMQSTSFFFFQPRNSPSKSKNLNHNNPYHYLHSLSSNQGQGLYEQWWWWWLSYLKGKRRKSVKLNLKYLHPLVEVLISPKLAFFFLLIQGSYDEPFWGFLSESNFWLIFPNSLVNLIVIELYNMFDDEYVELYYDNEGLCEKMKLSSY